MPNVRASDGSAPGPGAEHRPASRQAVELDDALGDVERMVVRQADDAGTEADRARQLTGAGEEHLRRGDRLPARRVVLTAPELVVAETVEVRDELEVALQLQRRIVPGRVVRGEERSELQPRHPSHARECRRI